MGRVFFRLMIVLAFMASNLHAPSILHANSHDPHSSHPGSHQPEAEGHDVLNTSAVTLDLDHHAHYNPADDSHDDGQAHDHVPPALPATATLMAEGYVPHFMKQSPLAAASLVSWAMAPPIEPPSA